MSKASEALRGLRQFGPEHFVELEALVKERDQLLSVLQSMVVSFAPPSYELDGASDEYLSEHFPEWFKARAAIAKATGQ